jgi:hypothetical protein
MQSSTRLWAAATSFVVSGLVAALGATSDPPAAAALIVRVGERVAAYYDRVQRLVCTERSTVIPVGTDGNVPAFARTVESELRVEIDESREARATRAVLRVNGREPRERDRTDRSGCTDPTPLSPELLTFLLPAQRDGYRFTSVRGGRERGRAALVIDFLSADRDSRPELIEDEYGHDDCFDWTGPVSVGGRLWIDAESHDVLRVDRHLSGPTDVRVPPPLQRKYRFPAWLTIDRDDLTQRFTAVTFTDPDETLLLPESIESRTVLRAGLQSIRRTQAFSNYRRFLTSTQIK